MIAILSYPRSGNHWVRYIVELLSGRGTIGCSEEILLAPTSLWRDDSPICCRKNVKFLKHVEPLRPIACKYHHPGKERKMRSYRNMKIEDASKLIVIIRHPMEAILSHQQRKQHLKRLRTVMLHSGRVLRQDRRRMAIGHYEEILDFYMSFKKPKIHIFYEDLIKGKAAKPIKKIANLLGASPNKTNALLANIEKYRTDSLGAPRRAPTSICSDSPKNFYSKLLSPRDRRALKKIISKSLNHPLIKERYK